MKSTFSVRFFVPDDAKEEEVPFTITLETFDAEMIQKRLEEELQSLAYERYLEPFCRAVDTLSVKEGAFDPSVAYIILLKFAEKTIVKLVLKEHDTERHKRVIIASVTGISDQPPVRESWLSVFISFLLCALLALVPVYFGLLRQ